MIPYRKSRGRPPRESHSGTEERKHRVLPLLLRNLLAFVLLAFSPTVTSAATFSWTVNCPDTVVGPITVLAQTYSDSVTLTPSVSATVPLLPTDNVVREDNPAAPQGTYPGLLMCTLTFGGVTVPFTRSFSLDVPPPGPTGHGLITTGAASFNVDLGSQGQVHVSAPVDQTGGFSRDLNPIPCCGLIIVPLAIDTTLLLTPAVPAPTLSFWGAAALLAALLGSGLLLLRPRMGT